MRPAYAFVHQAAHLLANHDDQGGAQVQAAFDDLLAAMARERASLGPLAPTIDHFLKVTASSRPGLFHCYRVPDLPRTNNDLEHLFGATRYQERRATGRKLASPTLVVRGGAPFGSRLVAAALTRAHAFTAAELAPRDVDTWRTPRAALEQRHAARRAQRRFRRDPEGYLASLEDLLLKPTLPP